jgi:Zn finger protein HypA/HybF involved in hydrogenase expression
MTLRSLLGRGKPLPVDDDELDYDQPPPQPRCRVCGRPDGLPVVLVGNVADVLCPHCASRRTRELLDRPA